MYICRSSAQSLANSVFALTGLALTMIAFTADLDSDLEVTLGGSGGHVSHDHWLRLVMNTLLIISDPSLKIEGQFIVLGNQVGMFILY